MRLLDEPACITILILKGVFDHRNICRLRDKDGILSLLIQQNFYELFKQVAGDSIFFYLLEGKY